MSTPYKTEVPDRRKLDRRTPPVRAKFYRASTRLDRRGTDYYLEVFDSNFGNVLCSVDDLILPSHDSMLLEQVAETDVPPTVRAKLEKIAEAARRES